MPTKTHQKVSDKEMYTIPIADRPPHGPLYSKIFFPILFNFGQIGINSAQILALPLLLIPIFGRKWFDGIIGWTKDGYGRLCTYSYNTPYRGRSSKKRWSRLIISDRNNGPFRPHLAHHQHRCPTIHEKSRRARFQGTNDENQSTG
jgi:hypothetical protein